MNFQWIKKAALATAFLMSSTCFAGVITDTKEINKTVRFFDPASWTHNILANGFNLGSALSASIMIELSDDSTHDDPEYANVLVGTFDFLDGVAHYNANNDWSGALGFNSLATLNSNGTVYISVVSDLGDFVVGNATLTVITADVPEPGSLILLGLGLLGLGLARRQK